MTTPQDEPSVDQLAAIFNYELKRRPLDPVEVADMTRKSVGTLENLRVSGKGPRFFKLGKHVVYSEVDVLRWLCQGAATSTSAYPTHMRNVPGRRFPRAPVETSAAAPATAST